MREPAHIETLPVEEGGADSGGESLSGLQPCRAHAWEDDTPACVARKLSCRGVMRPWCAAWFSHAVRQQLYFAIAAIEFGVLKLMRTARHAW
jgi:hypothetical protein